MMLCRAHGQPPPPRCVLKRLDGEDSAVLHEARAVLHGCRSVADIIHVVFVVLCGFVVVL